ncbi:MAG TPA: hydrogenase formation protein HypD [Firmicutes bacterium]|nr:hydrogenase formation protein HypD [Bacillota bacterium]
MDILDKYRSKDLVLNISEKANKILSRSSGKISLMEVCGTHTVEIFRFGLRNLFHSNLNLISGPGCPVCVTGLHFLDKAISLSRRDNITITTFGDMMRVPVSRTSLSRERSAGRDIRVVYSCLDSLEIASLNPNRDIVFLGVGFETTVPTVASTILTAKERGLKNFFVLSAHKTMPTALEAILNSDSVNINGLICPGHVSAITGIHIYDFIPERYNISCAVSGFEPLDIVSSIYQLCESLESHEFRVINNYSRVVTEFGNSKAQSVINEVFEESDEEWRGIGLIPRSGLKIKPEYSAFDADLNFPVEVEDTRGPSGCRCGEILRGTILPPACPLFRKTCTPENPIGACMVSSEGTCAAFYKYYVD